MTDQPNQQPKIGTQWGDVSESARLQAAVNMRENPSIRAAVESRIIAECGGDEAKGKAEFRRRYPEVFTGNS